MQDARASRKDIHPIGKKNPNLPFHPAVRAGDFIFVSGQVAKDAGLTKLLISRENELALRGSPARRAEQRSGWNQRDQCESSDKRLHHISPCLGITVRDSPATEDRPLAPCIP
jgi:hypothetical protein